MSADREAAIRRMLFDTFKHEEDWVEARDDAEQALDLLLEELGSEDDPESWVSLKRDLAAAREENTRLRAALAERIDREVAAAEGQQ